VLTVLLTGMGFVSTNRTNVVRRFASHTGRRKLTPLNTLYKEARELSVELTSRRELQKRAADLTDGLKKEAVLSTIARVAGNAIGRSIGTAGGVAAKVASKPVVAAGEAAKSVLNPKTKLGLGANVIKTTAGGVATLGLNSTMVNYNPGVNKVTGKSKDVWDSLQS